MATVADVDSPLGSLRVTATHLSFLAPSSGRQLRGLLAEAQHTDVLLGDLNMRPARVARLTGMRALVTADTFPVDAPVRQLDHVLAGDERLRATRAEALALPVSDHRALVVDCQPLSDSGSRKPVLFARTPRFHSQVSSQSTMPTASR